MPKILHIIDDQKFIPYAKATFEIENFENTYLEYSKIDIGNLKIYDLIIIHFLRSKYSPILTNNLFPIDKIVWIVWGADAFQLGTFFNKHLMFQTWKSRIKNSFKRSIRFGFSIFLRSLFPHILDFQKIFKDQISCISNIKKVWVLVPGDEKGIEKYNSKGFSVNHFNYLDPIFLEDNKVLNSGENILIGNSAEYTNNYQDVILNLKPKEIQDHKLIFPLNYGDEINANDVETKAKIKFKEKAVCLRQFMDINEYIALINTCEIAIMPHIRQQAIGNIVKLLLGGCHVYFNSKSNIYFFLNSHGFVVSSFFERESLRKLTYEEKKINIQLTKQTFGKDQIHSNTLKLLNEIL